MLCNLDPLHQKLQYKYILIVTKFHEFSSLDWLFYFDCMFKVLLRDVSVPDFRREKKL